MPQGVEVIETGRLMIRDARTVLVRDDGGCWGVFLDCRARDFIGRRVTARGTRFGFAMLHVTGVAPGSQVPPEARSFTGWLAAPAVAVQFAVIASLIWPVVRAIWQFAAGLLI